MSKNENRMIKKESDSDAVMGIQLKVRPWANRITKGSEGRYAPAVKRAFATAHFFDVIAVRASLIANYFRGDRRMGQLVEAAEARRRSADAISRAVRDLAISLDGNIKNLADEGRDLTRKLFERRKTDKPDKSEIPEVIANTISIVEYLETTNIFNQTVDFGKLKQELTSIQTRLEGLLRTEYKPIDILRGIRQAGRIWSDILLFPDLDPREWKALESYTNFKEPQSWVIMSPPTGEESAPPQEKAMTVPDVPETEKIENPGLWEKLCDVVLDQLQITLDQLKIETSLGLFNWSLMDDLGADSIDTVEVIMAVEKEFDIEIPDSDAERLKTVGDFYEYLHPRPSLRDDFSALAEKSDAELWQIAQRQLPSAKLLRCQQLIGKHEAGEVLTSEEQRELDILIEEGDRLTAIKLEAYVLLKQSGQRLPNLGIFA